MIPLRIYAEGFMCFREPVEMTFDGASLWMLTGNNGAGKSAVFDAILYALFGTHRKGTQNAHFILNKGSQCNLVVEFDFAVGDHYYRVKRTLSRKCRPTFQAFEGKSAGTAGTREMKMQTVDGTDSKEGLKEWVTRTVGLNEQAFTASVFLRQGKSDALLSAEKEERHAILGQIVDLSKYQKLEARADDLRKYHKGQADAFQSQLNLVLAVDESVIVELTGRIESAAADVEAARGQLDELIALKVHARRWDGLSAERSRLEREMRDAESLLTQGEAIERDAARAADLNCVLPTLRKLSQDRKRLAEIDARVAALRDEAALYAESLSRANVELNEAQAIHERLGAEQSSVRLALGAAQEALSQSAPRLARVEQLRQLRRAVAELDGQLSRFAPDLEERIAEVEQSLAALNVLRAALPSLRHYADVRSNWLTARAQAETAGAEVSRLTEELNRESAGLAASERDADEAQASLTEAERASTEAQLLYDQIQKRLLLFARLDGRAECDMCGQALTPEHLEAERSRLDAELLKRDAERQVAVERHQRAVAGIREKREAARQAGARVAETGRRLERASASVAAATMTQQQAEQQARATLSALPADYARRVSWDGDVEVTRCFAVEFPSDADLEGLQSQASRHRAVERQLTELRAQQGERQALSGRRAAEAAELASLASEYPAHVEQEIVDTHRSTGQEVEQRKRDLGRIEQQLDDAQRALRRAREQVEGIVAGQQKAEREADVAVARKQELEQNITAAESELGGSWREVARSLTAEKLRELNAEAERLAGAGERLKQLQQARDQQETRRERLDRIEDETSAIDVRACRPLAELEREEREVRGRHKAAEELKLRAEGERRDLEERRERRRTLESERLTHAQKTDLYKQLAALLGKDNLQHHLLRQAETSIVHNANNVLDSISGGTLRLELSDADGPADGETKGKGRGVKALDLVAYHSATRADALPVEFLSGSQRFRVAVSLALGIGQYASHGARRIESVIIDEGFGSLDKQGCADMIAELQRLKGVLGRIILVSHQEEVADAFPNNKYLVELSDGTSRVRLAEGS
jgi:DNA repair exonuclease SbcCD ATPase subunit